MLDIVIHRFIELPIQHVHQILEVILGHLGCLYKFHGMEKFPIGIYIEILILILFFKYFR